MTTETARDVLAQAEAAWQDRRTKDARALLLAAWAAPNSYMIPADEWARWQSRAVGVRWDFTRPIADNL